jgi:uncharacterized LabA/DUF88 family protein
LLFSGDSDFAPLLRHIKQYRKNSLVFSTKGHISKDLLNIAKFIDLKKLKPYIQKEK